MMCRWTLCVLGCGLTHTTSARHQKEYTMSLLEPLGTTYRVIWGIRRFVVTHRCRKFYWMGPRPQHPQHQHQGPKSVGHVPPGALKDHLKGQMGYQKICCNPQIQNILLTQHQHEARVKTGFSSSSGIKVHISVIYGLLFF